MLEAVAKELEELASGLEVGLRYPLDFEGSVDRCESLLDSLSPRKKQLKAKQLLWRPNVVGKMLDLRRLRHTRSVPTVPPPFVIFGIDLEVLIHSPDLEDRMFPPVGRPDPKPRNSKARCASCIQLYGERIARSASSAVEKRSRDHRSALRYAQVRGYRCGAGEYATAVR